MAAPRDRGRTRQPRPVANRSGAGDLDVIVYSARKWARLAASRYLGCRRGQKAAMTGKTGAHTNRPELVARHGYATKYAMHALRLGLQGIELLSTGRITLPVPDQPDHQWVDEWPHRSYLNFWDRAR